MRRNSSCSKEKENLLVGVGSGKYFLDLVVFKDRVIYCYFDYGILSSFEFYGLVRVAKGGKMSELLRVYLSGGFHPDKDGVEWGAKVSKACQGLSIQFLNPLEKERNSNTNEWRELHLTEEEKEEKSKARTQSPWWYQDKLAVEKADVIFCYLEDYRPKVLGTGTIFELGMAFALGKLVILVNKIEHRYYREFEHLFVSFKTLEEGIEFLKKCVWLR